MFKIQFYTRIIFLLLVIHESVTSSTGTTTTEKIQQSTVVAQTVATPSYTKLNKKYYIFEAEKLVNWYEAAHACHEKNGQLITIEGFQDMKAITDHLLHTIGAKANNWYWIGANDLSNEGEFLSLDTGKPIPYLKWGLNQPDNKGGNEHCVHLWLYNDNYFMNDALCRNKAHYICQFESLRRITFTVDMPASWTRGECSGRQKLKNMFDSIGNAMMEKQEGN